MPDIDFGDNPVGTPPTTPQVEQIKDILSVDSGDIVDATSLGRSILTASSATDVLTLIGAASASNVVTYVPQTKTSEEQGVAMNNLGMTSIGRAVSTSETKSQARSSLDIVSNTRKISKIALAGDSHFDSQLAINGNFRLDDLGAFWNVWMPGMFRSIRPEGSIAGRWTYALGGLSTKYFLDATTVYGVTGVNFASILLADLAAERIDTVLLSLGSNDYIEEKTTGVNKTTADIEAGFVRLKTEFVEPFVAGGGTVVIVLPPPGSIRYTSASKVTGITSRIGMVEDCHLRLRKAFSGIENVLIYDSTPVLGKISSSKFDVVSGYDEDGLHNARSIGWKQHITDFLLPYADSATSEIDDDTVEFISANPYIKSGQGTGKLPVHVTAGAAGDSYPLGITITYDDVTGGVTGERTALIDDPYIDRIIGSTGYVSYVITHPKIAFVQHVLSGSSFSSSLVDIPSCHGWQKLVITIPATGETVATVATWVNANASAYATATAGGTTSTAPVAGYAGSVQEYKTSAVANSSVIYAPVSYRGTNQAVFVRHEINSGVPAGTAEAVVADFGDHAIVTVWMSSTTLASAVVAAVNGNEQVSRFVCAHYPQGSDGTGIAGITASFTKLVNDYNSASSVPHSEVVAGDQIRMYVELEVPVGSKFIAPMLSLHLSTKSLPWENGVAYFGLSNSPNRWSVFPGGKKFKIYTPWFTHSGASVTETYIGSLRYVGKGKIKIGRFGLQRKT